MGGQHGGHVAQPDAAGQARQHVGKILDRVDTAELAASEDRVDDRRPLAAGVGAAEQEIRTRSVTRVSIHCALSAKIPCQEAQRYGHESNAVDRDAGDRTHTTYRIVVSDLEHRRPIWFGGSGRSEADMDEFFTWLGPRKSAGIRLAVMDMWKPFRTSTQCHAPQAAILFDKFHILRHLGDALDAVRKSEYGRLAGKDRRFIKGQKYTLLSSRENLTAEGRKSLKLLLAANQRLNTARLSSVHRGPFRTLGLLVIFSEPLTLGR